MSDRDQPPTDLSAPPPANTQRWVKSRKIAVIKAIDSGALSDEQACSQYNLSQEELDSWRKALNKHGPGALRTTHLNRYRRSDTPKQQAPPS